MENIKSIVNTINAYPPKDNEGIKSPLIKYPPLVIRTDAKNFKNFINEKSRLSRNKILKERRDALKPKKEVVKKPAKEDKALQKKNDYDQEIEERLKKLNDNLISNKNVLSGFVGNQQGDFMKLFTDIYKMGRGIVPKDFSSKSIEYATNLLNIVYSNPPKDKEGLIIPEQAFKTSAKGDGIFKPWISYLSETSEKQRRQVMKGYDEDKKPAVKKPAVKKESVKKVSVKKQPVEEVFTDSEEEEEYEPREITAMNDPLTKKLIEGTKSIRNTIKKDAKDDPSKITNMKVIIKMVKPIREFVRKLQLNNNVEFSEKIITKFEDDFIENFIDDLKEIGGLKQPASMVVNQMVIEEEDGLKKLNGETAEKKSIKELPKTASRPPRRPYIERTAKELKIIRDAEVVVNRIEKSLKTGGKRFKFDIDYPLYISDDIFNKAKLQTTATRWGELFTSNIATHDDIIWYKRFLSPLMIAWMKKNANPYLVPSSPIPEGITEFNAWYDDAIVKLKKQLKKK
jgi:hypothetical protein